MANKTKSLAGTPMYLAPELRRKLNEGKMDANYDAKKTDAYSLGCVIL
jgi:serine/threonine protein kinase